MPSTRLVPSRASSGTPHGRARRCRIPSLRVRISWLYVRRAACSAHAHRDPTIPIGFIRKNGRILDTLDHASRAVLAHQGQRLSLTALEMTTLGGRLRRRKPLFEHQVLAPLVCPPDPHDVAAVTDSPASDPAATLICDRLARAAREALSACGCPIQGGRDVDDWVKASSFG